MPRKSTMCGLAAGALTVVLLPAGCGDPDGTAQEPPTTGAAVETTLAEPERPGEFSGFVRSPAPDVSEVSLPAVDGSTVTMVAPPGGLRLVYFGYTSCPDVCPATLGYVKHALAEQSDNARELVEVDMITVDPSRDTAERLKEYVTRFVPDANALRTEDFVALRAAADAFGADFRSRYDEEGRRQVSHTDALYAVDDSGSVVLAWSFGVPEVDIARDLTRLLDGDRPEPELAPEAGGQS